MFGCENRKPSGKSPWNGCRADQPARTALRFSHYSETAELEPERRHRGMHKPGTRIEPHRGMVVAIRQQSDAGTSGRPRFGYRVVQEPLANAPPAPIRIDNHVLQPGGPASLRGADGEKYGDHPDDGPRLAFAVEAGTRD